MSTTYPSIKQTFTNPSSSSILNNPSHSSQHITENDTIVAIEDTLGTTAGTSVLKDFIAGNFAVRINSSNVLQQALSGTINNSVFGTPSISGGTANNILLGTPQITGGTITTPLINSPKIGTAIYDVNNNEVIKISPTTGAVNEITITNAGVGTGVSIQSSGNDANIDLLISSKGTAGKVVLGSDLSAGVKLANNQPLLNSAGLEIIKFPYTASAVNEITISNAATGVSPEISATGDDNNINLKLSSKGTGIITTSSNVGIGTTETTAKFEVVGNVKFNGGTINNVVIGTSALSGGTANSQILGTPTLTGGSWANGTLTSPVLGTPNITGGTHNNFTAGTPTIIGGSMGTSTITGGTASGLTLTTAVLTKPRIDAYDGTAAIYTATAGGTTTLDLSLSNEHRVTFGTGNVTLALTNDTNAQKFIVSLTQDAIGSRTVTWWSTIRWVDGAAPILTTTANKRDTFIFIRSGSSTYDGFIAGMNI